MYHFSLLCPAAVNHDLELYLVSFQIQIQGSCQLQHHGTGNGRISGALELSSVPLWWVVLGVVVTG